MAQNRINPAASLQRLERALKVPSGQAYQFYRAVKAQTIVATIDRIAEIIEQDGKQNYSVGYVVARILGLPLPPDPSENIQEIQWDYYENGYDSGYDSLNFMSAKTSINSSGEDHLVEIEWDHSLENQDDFSFIIGLEDAFEHSVIISGEKIAYCTADKVAYHLSTWRFLEEQNSSRCCVCGKKGTIKFIQLPSIENAPPTSRFKPKEDRLGEKTISLSDVYGYVGRAATVEAIVQEVYETRSTGAFYIRFEKREPFEPPFKGFKVVIRPRYVKEWSNEDISPNMYSGRTVRVRGIIHNDPDFGIEILINSPRVIQIVPDAGQS